MSGKNLSFDLSNRGESPVTDKIRESLFTKSKLSRHLADPYSTKERDYIQIDNERLHRSKLPDKLRGDQEETPEKGKFYLFT